MTDPTQPGSADEPAPPTGPDPRRSTGARPEDTDAGPTWTNAPSPAEATRARSAQYSHSAETGTFGTAAAGQHGPPENSALHRGSGLAVASLVLGLTALVLSPIPILPLLLALPGCVLGVLAWVRLRALPGGGRGQGRGLALAGLITSSVAVVVGIVASIIWATLVTVAGPQISEVVHCLQVSDSTQQEYCLDNAFPDETADDTAPGRLDPQDDQGARLPPDPQQA